jgi:signal transduction histidine kinase
MIRSLRAKLAWSHVIPTVLLLPILSLYLLFTLEEFYIHNLLRQLVYQAQLMRQDIEDEAIPITSNAAAQAFLNMIALSTDSHVVLLDQNAIILASTRQDDAARIGAHLDHPSIEQALRGETAQGLGPGLTTEVAYVALGWRQKEQAQGVLRLSYEVDDVRTQFDQLQWLVISTTAITVALALALAIGLAATISRPLRQLSERAQAIASGDFKARVDSANRDEVGLLAQSFNQMATHLEQAQQARDRQLAAIAHELTRPIAGMQAAVETLRDGADEDLEIRDSLLAGMEEELARLKRMITTLQGLHKRGLEPIQLNRTEIVFDRLVRAAGANFEPVAARTGVALSIDIANDLPKIRADEDRLIQVLTNLLDNAFKFTPPGGKIIVRASKESDGICITVADTGVGISPAELPNVFQQFYRGDETRPPEKRGMGLGLAICREIITAHQGKIWVESESGEGAIFTFTLPVH